MICFRVAWPNFIEMLAQTRLEWSFVHDFGNFFTYIGLIIKIFDVHVAWRLVKRWKIASFFTRQYLGTKRSLKCFIHFVRKKIIVLNRKRQRPIFIFYCTFIVFTGIYIFSVLWVFFFTRHLTENQVAHNEEVNSQKNHCKGATKLIRLPDRAFRIFLRHVVSL